MLGQAPVVAVAVAAVPPQPASLPLSDRVSIMQLARSAVPACKISVRLFQCLLIVGRPKVCTEQGA